MELLKGAPVAAAISEGLKMKIAAAEGVRKPKLAIIRVGERPDDISYEKGACKRMVGIGIDCESYVYPADISNDEFRKAFSTINDDDAIDGILLLRPLPKQIDEKAITELIHPQKDVDCIGPANMAKVFMGSRDGYAPCTAQAVVEMLDAAEIDLTGKNAVIIGRSLVVGRPLAMLLMRKNCTVTICHTKTVDMPAICRQADIVVACAGQMRMVNSDYISEAAVAVMDVGINWDAELGKLCGDVDFSDVTEHIASSAYITPVPGGVGAVTTSVLAAHVVESWSRKAAGGS